MRLRDSCDRVGRLEGPGRGGAGRLCQLYDIVSMIHQYPSKTRFLRARSTAASFSSSKSSLPSLRVEGWSSTPFSASVTILSESRTISAVPKAEQSVRGAVNGYTCQTFCSYQHSNIFRDFATPLRHRLPICGISHRSTSCRPPCRRYHGT